MLPGALFRYNAHSLSAHFWYLSCSLWDVCMWMWTKATHNMCQLGRACWSYKGHDGLLPKSGTKTYMMGIEINLVVKQIGSYTLWDDVDWKLLLTVELDKCSGYGFAFLHFIGSVTFIYICSDILHMVQVTSTVWLAMFSMAFPLSTIQCAVVIHVVFYVYRIVWTRNGTVQLIPFPWHTINTGIVIAMFVQST